MGETEQIRKGDGREKIEETANSTSSIFIAKRSSFSPLPSSVSPHPSSVSPLFLMSSYSVADYLKKQGRLCEDRSNEASAAAVNVLTSFEKSLSNIVVLNAVRTK